MEQYKYVFVLCASTNLERICALSKIVPKGKYFICDKYQSMLLDLIQKHWGEYSSLYRNIKKTIYGENLLPKFQESGFLMMVRDNRDFRNIMSNYDMEKSIILYSMWDGYRTKQGSTIPEFLNIVGRWVHLHTSGHTSKKDIQMIIEIMDPEIIIPIHTNTPGKLKSMCPNRKVVVINDNETFQI